MTQFTAQAQMTGLKERLGLSVAGEEFFDSFDVNGFPVLRVLNHSENSFLTITMIEASGHVDAFGLPQRQYSPHKCILVREASATTSAIETAVKVLAQAAKLGMKVEIYEGTGAGAEVTYAAAFALCTLIATLPANEIYGMTLSQ
jgi:hypothetical protein